MQDFGLCLLGRAIKDATFSEMLSPYVHAMAVVTCAQAAEIIIKARIAQEHPLLIFTKLPKPDPASLLDIGALMAGGRTLTYEELPGALWAATGYCIANLQQFDEFGRLRNTITHFAVPDSELNDAVLRYAFNVVEPMIFDFWKADIVECYERFGEEEEYILEQIVRLGIPFKRKSSG